MGRFGYDMLLKLLIILVFQTGLSWAALAFATDAKEAVEHYFQSQNDYYSALSHAPRLTTEAIDGAYGNTLGPAYVQLKHAQQDVDQQVTGRVFGHGGHGAAAIAESGTAKNNSNVPLQDIARILASDSGPSGTLGALETFNGATSAESPAAQDSPAIDGTHVPKYLEFPGKKSSSPGK